MTHHCCCCHRRRRSRRHRSCRRRSINKMLYQITKIMRHHFSVLRQLFLFNTQIFHFQMTVCLRHSMATTNVLLHFDWLNFFFFGNVCHRHPHQKVKSSSILSNSLISVFFIATLGFGVQRIPSCLNLIRFKTRLFQFSSFWCNTCCWTHTQIVSFFSSCCCYFFFFVLNIMYA